VKYKAKQEEEKGKYLIILQFKSNYVINKIEEMRS
jgi:hypothetical protein